MLPAAGAPVIDDILASMQIIPGWHPIVVHFAVALSVTAAFALLVSRFVPALRMSQLAAVLGTFNLCLGAVFSLLAIVTGLAAVWDLHLAAAPRAAVSTHVKWAFFTTLALMLIAVWRGFGCAAEDRPSNVFVAALIGTMSAVSITAYFGGENVYRYGIGVLTH
jgi:uncharacterized membrane protein